MRIVEIKQTNKLIKFSDDDDDAFRMFMFVNKQIFELKMKNVESHH